MYLTQVMMGATGKLPLDWMRWTGINDGDINTSLHSGANPIIVKLTTTKAVVIYNRTYALMGCVINTSGTVVTVGTPVRINYPGYVYYSSIGAGRISDSKVLIAYSEYPGFAGIAAVLTINGDDTISCGTPLEFTSNAIEKIALAVLTSTKAVVAYNDTVTSKGESLVLNVSGEEVTSGGTEYEFNASASIDDSLFNTICRITDTRAMICHHSSGLKANYLDVSSNTITVGTVTTLVNTSSCRFANVASMSESVALIAYNNYTVSALNGYYTSISTSSGGATPSVTATVKFASTYARNFTVCPATTTQAVIAYVNGSASGPMKGVVFDTTDGAGSIVSIGGTTCTWNTACMMEDSKILLLYLDTGLTPDSQVTKILNGG